jgi:hypothetical protein
LDLLASAVLAAHSQEEALEELNTRVGSVARRNQVRLLHAESATDTTRLGFLRRVTLRIESESDLAGLMEFLHALGRDSTVIGLSALQIAAADPRSPQSSPEVLRSGFTISGWYIAPEASRGAGK